MTENSLKTLPLHDGFAVETVYYGSGTLCISTQAGCRMACPFCASGRAGLKRNLTLQEMQAQVDLHTDADVKRITMSGIGEPLDNLEAVTKFISASLHPVSLTTSVPDTSLLKKLINLHHNGLMLSLHAGTDETHKKLVPKAENLNNIFTALADIWENISGNKKRKIGINYLLFEGVNDSAEEVAAFIERVLPFKEVTVHLLYCNPVEKSIFRSPSVEKYTDVYNKIREAGLNVRRANNWRKEAKGGCGTLFLKTLQK